MPTGPQGPTKPDPITNDATGPFGPSAQVKIASSGSPGVPGPRATGPQGAAGLAVHQYVGGVSGPTGPRGPEEITEMLHNDIPLPFDGFMVCVKQGKTFGIKYADANHRLGNWLAVFDGVEYHFSKDPARPWMGVEPLRKGEFKILGQIPTEAEALAMSAAHQAAHGSQGQSREDEALDLYQQHVGNKMWADFVEDAMDTFHVAGVMTS